MSGVKTGKTEFCGWKNCIVMENDSVRLILTTDIGPRIVYFGDQNGNNMFHLTPEHKGRSGDAEWMIYGGHRLWTSPQEGERPNQPDNRPVAYEISGGTVELMPETEEKTHIQKRISVTLAPEGPCVTVHHTLINRGLWPVTLAPWSLSVMHEGGCVVLPIPRNDTLYMPNYAISFWPWTKPNDPRFTLGGEYILLHQDEQNKEWFKIGYHNTEGWGAYVHENGVFVKVSRPLEGAVYPDYDSNFEVYTDETMAELESLGQLKNIRPGESIEHTEQWYFHAPVGAVATENDVREKLLPVIRELGL